MELKVLELEKSFYREKIFREVLTGKEREGVGGVGREWRSGGVGSGGVGSGRGGRCE